MKYLYPSLRQGLVGAWCPSLGSTGYTLRDQSGYNNHGTLTNMDAGTDWVANKGKIALDFDGSNDYAVASSTITGPPITLVCWCSQTSAVSYGGPLSSNNIAMLTSVAGTVMTYFWQGTTDEYDAASGLSVTNGSLDFRALVVTSTYAKLYLNGLSWTNTKAHSSKTFTNIYVGTERNIHPFSGFIYDSSVFTRALADNEINLLRSIGPGGMYAMAPRRRYAVPSTGGTFQAAWAKRRNILLGAVVR